MTEAEWQVCQYPGPMLESLAGTASDRKLRLYCCACCRRFDRVWRYLGRARRRAVEAAERAADGQVTLWGWLAREVLTSAQTGWEADRRQAVKMAAYIASHDWRAGPAMDGIGSAVLVARLVGSGHDPWIHALADLVRDVFRHPTQGTALDPRWRTSDTVGLARGIYDEQAFDRMPLLADALMDAGCSDDQIISHCRTGDPHVRGCWVVDLLLSQM